MKNILIVGGAGYVGGAITDRLELNNNYQIRVYDSLLYEESYRKPVDFVLGDIRDKKKLSAHLQWADVVVWLAALVGDGACQLNPDLTTEINQNSVKWLADNFDGRIIFMSTCSVYGAQNNVLDETSPTNPLSVYAATKLNAEGHLKNKNAIIFRLGTLFGIGDQFSRIRMDLVVNILTIKAQKEGRISVFGGEQYRPLLHVKDVAIAVEKNLDSNHKGIFNLVNQNLKIIDLAYQIKEFFPNCVIKTTDMPFQDTRNYKVSCKKAKEAFGFKTKYSISRGIEELQRLVQSNRIKNVDHHRYSNQRYLENQIGEIL